LDDVATPNSREVRCTASFQSEKSRNELTVPLLKLWDHVEENFNEASGLCLLPIVVASISDTLRGKVHERLNFYIKCLVV